MPFVPQPFHSARLAAGMAWCLALVAGLPAFAAPGPDPDEAVVNTPPPTSPPSRNPFAAQRDALARFIDRLPELPDLGLPSFAPSGAVRLHFRPRFGDLKDEDYFRLPVGARIKVADRLELNAELGGYITNGLRDNAGNGLYQFRTGMKYERALDADSGWSAGFEWNTPLSHPPIEMIDGLRHTLPYVTFTRTVMPRYGLVGFATLGADLIDRTSLPENYAENQLRSNSLILTLGVAREWRRMHVILRVFDANTAPLSGESENVFGLRPSIGVPILRRDDGTPRATVTFEGRTIWGPDGFETGISTRVRVDLRYRRK
ncbi:MAG TPA: hypothetical protein VEA63_16265 [Opitutus sp.]|nr:hypothetical protein [Opitutus sp.]